MSRPTYVYVIVSGEFTKIGIAADPNKRVKEVRVGSPEGAQVFYARQFPELNEARYVERYCHRQLGKLRNSGEWFRCSPHKARALVAKAKVPARAELEANNGTGWKEPSREEIREALELTFPVGALNV